MADIIADLVVVAFIAVAILGHALLLHAAWTARAAIRDTTGARVPRAKTGAQPVTTRSDRPPLARLRVTP